MKTIKQIADEIGVSKQAVQKRIAREPLYTCIQPYISTKQGTKYVDEEGENLIKSVFAHREDETVSIDTSIDVADNHDNHVYTLVSMLQRELDAKNEQLREKDEQLKARDRQLENLTAALEHTTESLHAAQALHAGTIQKQLTDGTGDPAESDVPGGIIARLFKKKRSKENQ